MAIGTALLDLTKLAQSHSTPVPTSMTLLGKAMLNLDGTIRVTDMIIDKLANDQLTLRLEVDRLDDAIKSLNRAANRLSLSIIVASMILGGKLVVDTLGKTEKQANGKRRRRLN